LLRKSPVAAPRAVVVRVNDVYGRSVGGGEEQLARADGINVVDVIEYNPSNYDPNFIAARLAQDRPDYLWDVSYIDDGVAIWNAVLSHHIALKGAIGTSSAFCMQQFSERVGAGSVGVYAADKPDANISPAALSPSGQALLAQAKAAYPGGPMDIAAVAGFVGGWSLFHYVLPNVRSTISAESIRVAAHNVDVPVGDSINGGGVKFAGPGALDEGQNTRAAAVVGQWQAVGVMRVVYPPAYAD
jgi:ABC-type branched-subunit amino acid transport system substrate-binding protein